MVMSAVERRLGWLVGAGAGAGGTVRVEGVHFCRVVSLRRCLCKDIECVISAQMFLNHLLSQLSWTP